MLRLFRLFLTCFGLCLLLLTLLQASRPAESTRSYVTLLGSPPDTACCYTYMAEGGIANRVGLGAGQAPRTQGSTLSASTQWRFAYLINPRVNETFFVPVQGGDPIRLPNEVTDGIVYQWAEGEDVLYFVGRGENANGLFTLRPPDTQPQRLTRDSLGVVRAISERRLPEFDPFYPFVLIFLGFNILLVGWGVRLWERDYTPPPEPR